MACNVCDDALHDALVRGNYSVLGGRERERHCAACQSRPRTRTFRLIFDEQVVPWAARVELPRRALDIAGVRATKDILSAEFPDVVVAALVGRAVTTDIRDLKEFGDGEFGVVTACEVLDYILELDDALAAVNRVLAPGGLFLAHIDRSRLRDDDRPPEATRYLENLGGYYPDDYRVPSIAVGRQHFMRRLAAAGFRAEQIEYEDPFSGYPTAWFIGRKLEPLVISADESDPLDAEVPKTPVAAAPVASRPARASIDTTYVLFTIDTEANHRVENGFWSYCVNGHFPRNLETLVERGLVEAVPAGFRFVDGWREHVVETPLDAGPDPTGSDSARVRAAASGGLPLIFDALEPYGFPAVSLIDMSALQWFGRPDFEETMQLCSAGGHDVQLHVHLESLGRDWLAELGLDRRALGRAPDWPKDALLEVHRRLADELEGLVGHRPVAYRAGGYRCSDAVIDSLVELGIAADLSYDHHNLDRHSICRDRVVGNGAFSYRGLIELPVTALRAGTRIRRFEPRPWHVDHGPRELRTLDEMHRSGVRVITYIMHSYSLMRLVKREDGRAWRGASPEIREWFDRTLEHIAAQPGLEVVDVRGLLQRIADEPAILKGADTLVSF